MLALEEELEPHGFVGHQFRGEAPWSPHMADQSESLCCMEAKLVQPISIPPVSHPVVHDSAAANVAAAYNQAGGDYVAYADGDPTHLFAFNGLHAYADRRVWTLLEAKLTDLRATGASSICILDAGCGPGTWLRRLSPAPTCWRLPPLPRAVLTSRGCRFNARGCWLGIFAEFQG